MELIVNLFLIILGAIAFLIPAALIAGLIGTYGHEVIRWMNGEKPRL